MQELSRASEALHAGGQTAEAEALADGFAGGVDAASRKLAEEHNIPVGSPALQSAFDPFYPPGLQWYWRADFVGTIPDAAVEELV